MNKKATNKETWETMYSNYVTGAGLRKLYGALEDEATPYELHIRRLTPQGRSGAYTHLVTVLSNNQDHFVRLIENSNK